MLLIGFVLGVACYLWSAYQRGRFEIIPLIESASCGAGIAAGLHLMMGAVDPRQLIHVTRESGEYFDLTGLVVEMDALHRVHLAIGALATIGVATAGLVKFCRASNDH